MLSLEDLESTKLIRMLDGRLTKKSSFYFDDIRNHSHSNVYPRFCSLNLKNHDQHAVLNIMKSEVFKCFPSHFNMQLDASA